MLFKNYDQIVSNGQIPKIKKKRKDILDILTVALDSVSPYNVVKRLISKGKINVDNSIFNILDFENVYIVGFGKASIGMTQAVCDSINVTKGVVITNDDSSGVNCDKIDAYIGGHPIPNEGSMKGTEKLIEVVKKCTKNDLLIVLISGGGSALLCKSRVSLEDLQKSTNLLLKSGADINEVNTIRKHLSHVKGGQLVKLTKGLVLSLIISDIVNDPVEFISSGPTSPDTTTFLDAKKVFEKYNLWSMIPANVKEVIKHGIKGEIKETPKNEDPIFENVYNFIVANNEIACNTAVEKAKSLGYNTKLITTSLTGEAKYASNNLIEKVKDQYKKKTVYISGGETTVTIKGDGKGGRNQELVLGSVKHIAGSDIVLASFATDGIDGKSDAAGAIADGFTYSRAKDKKIHPGKYLEDNNSYEFFLILNDLLLTGPSGTNVMDIQLIVI